jgi:ribosomal protein L37AE/L43A
MTSPSEEERQQRQQRPMPCPECESTKGYSRVGNYRVQCKNCNSLLKNEEVEMQLPPNEANEERQ